MTTPIACNPNAFTSTERARYDTVRAETRRASREVRELEHGFAIHFSIEPSALASLAEWIALERKCCPFLDFDLRLRADADFAELAITGPDPSKEILREAIAGPLVSPQDLLRR